LSRFENKGVLTMLGFIEVIKNHIKINFCYGKEMLDGKWV
jgi:hypothetical protein